MAKKKDKKKVKEAEIARLLRLKSKKESIVCTQDAALAGKKVCVLAVCLLCAFLCLFGYLSSPDLAASCFDL
jgi:hypothetical protein